MVPQKICVPSIPIRFTSTRLSTIDFAVGDGTLESILRESANEVQSLFAVLML